MKAVRNWHKNRHETQWNGKEPRNKSTHIRSINLQQRSLEYTRGNISGEPGLSLHVFLSCIGKNPVLSSGCFFPCVSFATHSKHFTFVHHMYGSFPTLSNSKTIPGCPIIQLNSDAFYIETASSKGSVPQDCPPTTTSDANYKQQVPRLPRTSVQFGYKLEVPMIPSSD